MELILYGDAVMNVSRIAFAGLLGLCMLTAPVGAAEGQSQSGQGQSSAKSCGAPGKDGLPGTGRGHGQGGKGGKAGGCP